MSSAALLQASLAFAVEDRRRSWVELGVTAALYGATVVATVLGPLPVKLLGSGILGLLHFRLFVFVHDAEHGAIFRGSRLSRPIVGLIGALTVVSPSVWREFHDYHHRTAGVAMSGDLWGYRVGDRFNRALSLEGWRRLTPVQRFTYRLFRHPLFYAVGYFTVFWLGSALGPILRSREARVPGLVVALGHLGIWALAVAACGPWNALFVLLLPLVGSSALGCFLFLAQHSFPGVRYRTEAEPRDHVEVALENSSFFEMPRWLHWFLGNIGYHHVHHLNPGIPFYRLPEAMAALPELQHPHRVRFTPRDVAAVFRLMVWDPDAQQMRGAAEAG